MELMTVQSKTDQIFEVLRTEIRQNKIAVGSRFSNVRDLAQRFGVCTRSISIALERLQRENLVMLKHGKGIYVKNWRQADIIEVFFLIWSQYDAEDYYRDMLMAMTCPPHRRRGFRFNIRSIFDEKLDQTHLEQEVRAISAMSSINCLLINANGIEPSTIPLFKNLHIPVIFLGDFIYDDMEDINLNQVTGDSFMGGYRSIEFMHWHGHKETLLLMPGETFYYNLFLRGAMKAAVEFGVKVEYHPMPYKDNYNRDGMRKAMEILVGKIGQTHIRSMPMIIYGLGIEKPAQALGKYWHEDSPPWVMPGSDRGSSQIFYDTVFSGIEDVSRNNSPSKRLRFEVPLLMTDIITHQQWLYRQHFEPLKINSEIDNNLASKR